MHDTVIRGGSIIDGTGAKTFTGDVAIEGEKIVSVGGKAGPAKRDIDANGLMVTPGWVDIHTHYDGQATWDPMMTPSSWHGVTTVLFGNCGVGFAPARKEHREALVDLMEGVEDIPGIALTEGLKWDWESFPDFLDAVERMPRTIDVAAQMPHHPLRVYVMGDRAIRREAATAEDIAAMTRLTEEALQAGAFGFTTSRTDAHKTPAGDFVPARYAENKELMGIGSALGKVGRGAFGMLSDFDDEPGEFEWMTKLSKDTGRPVWFLLTDRAKDPQRIWRLMDGVHKARAEGAQLVAQTAGRAVGVIMGLSTSYNPFSIRNSYSVLEKLSAEEKRQKLLDPAIRRMILADSPAPEIVALMNPVHQAITTRWDRIYPMSGRQPDYEPTDEMSIAGIAARSNRSPDEICYDYLTEAPDRFLFFPVTNYVNGSLESTYRMLNDDATLLGLGDAGAHCGMIMDASVPTFMLTHWGRDRSRGPKLELEKLVKMQTSETSDFFGFKDRGRIKAGLRADVNLIDFDKLDMGMPEIVFDLPAGGKRLIQKAEGYAATLVAGRPTFERGIHTGEMPGKLVRAGH
jgi:N-acyl-D-aspartate/D-glutamate deacylase